MNKAYAEYKQLELNENSEKTGKALGKHVISLHLTRIYQVFKNQRFAEITVRY